ncbi:hypothetical protein LCGC14_0312350 [marine sediment metagenome]|uniref:DNA/pantothenate metabolism flavoprotein C-terminal domain-containing protein n=1 Tax=marine sediment metagenome TaxID=412755 RepID=A0A0F9WTG5_9ZZZZ|nr:phosphopantothenoylcysteine decarboxylase [Phycisphaerae bacterium]HDZ44821.1 phosphopantothenoylcysteine decarboxylase [Phycisphaerae bacterium]
MKILITAGPTCEDIDPIRFLTNRSSGRLGYAIAAEAARRGHNVVLVSGPTNLDPPPEVRTVNVRSAADMLAASVKAFGDCRVAVLVAAVADFKPAEYSPAKIKKDGAELVLRLVATDDVAKRLGEMKTDQFIVGFALETGDGRDAAHTKRRDKNMDAIVLNDPKTLGADEISAEILADAAPWDGARQMSKAEFAVRVLDFIERCTSA